MKLHQIPLSLALLMAPAATLLADTVVINKLAYNDAIVTGVKGDQLVFTFMGREIRRPLAEVDKLILKDEPALTAAEEAYARQDWNKAVDSYDKVARSTAKPWLRDYVSARLLDAANRGNRFDIAIKSLIAQAEKSPDAARSVKLNMPAANSQYLPEAINAVNTALKTTKKDDTREVLLGLLVDLNNAKGDLKGAADALRQRTLMKATDPNSPEARQAAVALKLQTLKLALASKDWDNVIEIAIKEGELFTDPADQAEVLFALAEARAAKAAASTDPAVWKDIALAYMRVVANAPSGSAHVPQALLKTASIHEKQLNEPQTALAIYQSIAADFKDQEVGKTAEKEIQRLK